MTRITKGKPSGVGAASCFLLSLVLAGSVSGQRQPACDPSSDRILVAILRQGCDFCDTTLGHNHLTVGNAGAAGVVALESPSRPGRVVRQWANGPRSERRGKSELAARLQVFDMYKRDQ